MTTTTTDEVGEEEEKSLGQYDWLVQARYEFCLVIGPSKKKKTQSIEPKLIQLTDQPTRQKV